MTSLGPTPRDFALWAGFLTDRYCPKSPWNWPAQLSKITRSVAPTLATETFLDIRADVVAPINALPPEVRELIARVIDHDSLLVSFGLTRQPSHIKASAQHNRPTIVAQ